MKARLGLAKSESKAEKRPYWGFKFLMDGHAFRLARFSAA